MAARIALLLAAALVGEAKPVVAAPADRGPSAVTAHALLQNSWMLARLLRQRDRSVAAAQARIDQADAGVAAARLWQNPQFGWGAGALPLGPTNPHGTPAQDIVNFTWSISQPVELGKRGPRVAAARQRARVVRLSATENLLDRMYEARHRLGDVVYLAARVAIQRQLVAEARQILGVEAIRERHGGLSGYEVDRLAVDNASLAVDAAADEGRLAAARIACRTFVGAACDSAPALGMATLDQFVVAPPAALRASLGARPDIQSMAALKRAFDEDGRLARRQRVPDLLLTLGYVYDRFHVSGNQGNSVFFNVGITLPIFDHGQAEELRAAAGAREQEAQIADTYRLVGGEVKALLARRQIVSASLLHLRRDVQPRAQAMLEAALKAYRGGGLSLTEMLLARRAKRNVRLALAALQFERFELDLRLHRALALDAAVARQVLGVTHG